MEPGVLKVTFFYTYNFKNTIYGKTVFKCKVWSKNNNLQSQLIYLNISSMKMNYAGVMVILSPVITLIVLAMAFLVYCSPSVSFDP